MLRLFRTSPILLPLVLVSVHIAPSPALSEDTLKESSPTTEITIYAEPISDKTASSQREELDPRLDFLNLSADSGSLLTSLPGISGNKMGAHGVDPVIRGQGQSRVQTLLDGAAVISGCPNRMDPASSYASPLAYDKIEIIRNNNTVLYGGNTTGGHLLFKREPPKFPEGKIATFSTYNSLGSNGTPLLFSAKGAAGKEGSYLRSFAQYSDADNYSDGNGDLVRSGYRSRIASVQGGFKATENTLLEASWDGVDTDDVLFAGAGMDAPQTSLQTWGSKIEQSFEESWIENLQAEYHYSSVDHLMDNYSLRDVSPEKPLLKADSKTKAERARLLAETGLNSMPLYLGTDILNTRTEALRFAGQSRNNVSKLQSVLWPDVKYQTWGVFSELKVPFGELVQATTGLRYDYVQIDAEKIGISPIGAPSPEKLYNDYYGEASNSDEEHHWSGFLLLEKELADEQTSLFASVSQAVRTADATERYIASNAMEPGMRWVGNPLLDPEYHRQAETGAQWKEEENILKLALFHDWVENFILRDSARGQSGILRDDKATIYRNVSARLWGAELSASLKPFSYLELYTDAAYVHAENTTDDRAIAQIPPLNGRFEGAVVRDWLRAGSRLRWALQQSRVDDSRQTGSGLDVRNTPGYAVVDLFASFTLLEDLRLDLGVDNLFNQNYAEHLNKANLFDVSQVQVNEPGINFWVAFRAEI